MLPGCYFDNVILHNDTIVQIHGFCTDVFFQAALGWIKKQHDSGTPYFAYISTNAPHGPMLAPEKNNVIDQHPEVITRLRKAYDLWWEETVPQMVNETRPLAAEHPRSAQVRRLHLGPLGQMAFG